MRFYGLVGKAVQKLGVSVSLLPGGEIFPALEKKAIDASEFSLAAIDARLGFYKVVKNNYFPGWHQQATLFELLINKDVWNGLSESHEMMEHRDDVCGRHCRFFCLHRSHSGRGHQAKRGRARRQGPLLVR